MLDIKFLKICHLMTKRGISKAEQAKAFEMTMEDFEKKLDKEKEEYDRLMNYAKELEKEGVDRNLIAIKIGRMANQP